MKNKLVISIILISIAFSAKPQVPSLDTSFGIDGKTIIHNIHSSSLWNNGSNKILRQLDGKILVLTNNIISSDIDIALIRFLQDGTPDLTFGNFGTKLINMSSQDFGGDFAIQQDNKIVIAGSTVSGTDDDFWMIRLLPNGDLDSTFGVNGSVISNNNNQDVFMSIKIQPDQKIIAGGFSNANPCFARFNVDGSPDTAFGENGFCMVQVPSISFIYSIDICENNNIIGVGNYFASTSNGIFVKLDSSGNPVNGFGSGGYKIIDLGENEYFNSVKYDGQKYFIAGTKGTGSNGGFLIAKFLLNGNLDLSFNGAGYRKIELSDNPDMGYDLTIDSKNNILVYGQADYLSQNLSMVKILPSGLLDENFGISGIWTIDFGSSVENLTKAQLIDDYNVLICGYTGQNYEPFVGKCIISEFNPINAADNTSLSIYPNPAQNVLNINFYNTQNNSKISYDIFSTEGKLLIHKDITAFINTPGLKIDISGLSKGFYVLKIYNEEKVFSQKFMKSI